MSLPVINSPGIPVVWQTHPFGGDTRHVMISPNGRMPSIAEIVAGIPELPDSIRLDGQARINGLLVERDFWPYVRPKYCPGSVGVTLHHALEKGGNAGSIIAIGALIAAAAISGGAALPFLTGLGLTGTSLTIATTGLAAGVGILGSLAATALAPPPITDDTTGNTATGPEIGNAALGNNGIEKGGSIQRVIGTYRVAPQRLTEVLLEQVGQDMWAECIYGLAGPHKIWEIYFDGQLVDVASNINVQIETREGWVSDAAFTLITRQSKTDAVPITLSQHRINDKLPTTPPGSRLSDSQEAFNDNAVVETYGGAGSGDPGRTIDVTKTIPQWHTFTTRAAPDEFWITLEYRGGLFDSRSNPAGITFWYNGNALRLRMRRKGDVSWINLPELHVASGVKPDALRLVIKLFWSDQPTATIPMPPDYQGPGFYIAYKNVPGRTWASPTTAGWTADARFSGGTVVNAARDQALSSKNATTTNVRNVRLFEDRAELYLGSTGTFAHTGSGIWEIEIRQSEHILAKALWDIASSDADAPGSYTYWSAAYQGSLANGNVQDFFEYLEPAANDYHTTNLMTHPKYEATVTRRVNIWNEYPITEAGTDENRLAKIAIRVRNQNIGVITVKASGYIHVYSGGNWNSYAVSSNPAENLREILSGQLGKLPQSVPAINDTNLLSWRQHCIDNDYTIDTVVASKSYRELLKLVASAGWARVREAEQWGVIVDKDHSAETPGQIFTAREVLEFSLNKSFARLPDGFRATFLNEDDDYVNDEIVVLDPLNPEADEGRVEEVAYAAFTDPVKVAARALFDIMQARKRQTSYEFKTDTLSVMCERGDLIGVNYDTLSRRYGSARINRISVSGGNVTGLVLDGTINELPTTAYARIRKKSGLGYIDAQLVPFAGATDSISFVTPFANPGTTVLDVDALVWVGDLVQTERRLIVTNVAPSSDFTAVITAVDEAPEIFS